MPSRYCDYFEVDETYFPCIDESAIRAGAPWETTYPHEAFIDLLSAFEKMLSGSTKRSLWIHGAYGTGKSQCVLAARRIFEVPEEELQAYWDSFDQLKNDNQDLLQKIIGHRNRGVAIAFRYASGDISTPQQLFIAVQESVRETLEENGVEYRGENTFKESTIAYLEDSTHKNFVNELLQKPEWKALFSQSSVEEIVDSLKNNTDVTALMDNILQLGAKEGIQPFTLTADRLKAWLLDVINQNGIKIIFIWDEFSDFFRQNGASLSEFQKLATICEEAPFYMAIVTHPISSISSNSDDKSWMVVRERFEKVEITLPSYIAFELISHAFEPKKAALNNWQKIAGDLNARVSDAGSAVLHVADIKGDDKVIRGMLPIHPMAALVLKNIATAYQANQRSMFDFIKTPPEMDTQAFQWFIQSHGPEDSRAFLTVDMLWNFFYESGKDYLTASVKQILDAFSRQKMLSEKEQVVLKTILIMQAVSQGLNNSIDELEPTDRNLRLAFEGDNSEYESSCVNIADALVNKDVLIKHPRGNQTLYSIAILIGGMEQVEKLEQDVRKNISTKKLVDEVPELKASLKLTPALKLRFAEDMDTGSLPVITKSNYASQIKELKYKDDSWHFIAVLALAIDTDEAREFRNQIDSSFKKGEFEDIVVIDALDTPLGNDALEKYVQHSARSMYYNGNDNAAAADSDQEAKSVLKSDWRDRIYEGRYAVYSTGLDANPEKVTGANSVHSVLESIVLKRFRYVFDFDERLKEVHLKLTMAKNFAQCGITKEVKGAVKGCEQVLAKAWHDDCCYWEDPELSSEAIVPVKKEVEKTIAKAFEENGEVSISEIYDNCLEGEFGFSRCNLSIFLTGFLLSEYSGEPYRWRNSEGFQESMEPSKLAEMLAQHFQKGNSKDSYIVNLTEKEVAFYKFTEQVWGSSSEDISSIALATTFVSRKMRDLSYPVWCLEEVVSPENFAVLEQYIQFVQSESNEAHNIANQIGETALQNQSLGKEVNALLTPDNCMQGMKLFLEKFDDGHLLSIADGIGAKDLVLSAIKDSFGVQYASFWSKATGEEIIRKLTYQYEFVRMTNELLCASTQTKEKAAEAWSDKLHFVPFSCDLLRQKRPNLSPILTSLLKIADGDEASFENLQTIVESLENDYSEIEKIFENELDIFRELYQPYLEDFSDIECEEIVKSLNGVFGMSARRSNEYVKEQANFYQQSQLSLQLKKMWQDKAEDTKSPKAWSEQYKTPILSLVSDELYSDAKRAFAVLNGDSGDEAEIEMALEFIKKADFFDNIAKKTYRDKKFLEVVVGDYAVLLKDPAVVRKRLGKLGISAYEWSDDPRVKNEIKEMARAEYNAGGSDQADKIIEKMDDDNLRKWLKESVADDLDFGLKIIINEDK